MFSINLTDMHKTKSMNVDVYYLSKVQSHLSFIDNFCVFYFCFSRFIYNFFLSPLQLEALSRKDQSIDMEGAQQAIQLVPTITN